MLQSGFEPESSARKAGMIGRATLLKHMFYAIRFLFKRWLRLLFFVSLRVSITRHPCYIYILVMRTLYFSSELRIPPSKLKIKKRKR